MSDFPTLDEICLSLKCGHCGAKSGEPCFRTASGKKISFFHLKRANPAKAKLMSLKLKFSDGVGAGMIGKENELLKHLQPICDTLNETGKKQLVDIVEFIAMHGIYPGEVLELLDTFIMSSTGRRVFRDSPRLPQMDELVRMCRERGATHRTDGSYQNQGEP